MYHQLRKVFRCLLKEKTRWGLNRAERSTDTAAWWTRIYWGKNNSCRTHCIREGRMGTADVSAARGFLISKCGGKKCNERDWHYLAVMVVWSKHTSSSAHLL